MEAEKNNGWFDWVSNILSWILVPIMMPVYGLMLIFKYSVLQFVPPQTMVVFLLVIFGVNVLFSMICFYFLKVAGIVEDVGLNGRKERLIPYIITIFNLCVSAWLVYTKGAPSWVALFYLGGAAGAFINLIVNFWWKISAHAAGMAGLVALMTHLWRADTSSAGTFWVLIILILLTGLLGTCRIWLGRHTCGQVMAGYAVGFTCVFFLMMLTP